MDNKIYLFFSHTIKDQKANMPMLQKIIAGGFTLIDYEKITDDQGRRLIFFGNYAGDAGALEILYLTGRYWNHHGLSTPFFCCKRPVDFDSVKSAHQDLTDIGEQIKSRGLPAEISPMVIGILGYGNVSIGAQSLLDCLPVERISPENLPAEFPNDASTFFSNQLKGFLANILKADFQKPLQESGLCKEVQKAVIVYRGALTAAYDYLERYL